MFYDKTERKMYTVRKGAAMNSIVEKRKQYWVDFYDITSPVNRLLVVDYTKDFPQRPPLWWEMQKEREEWAYQRYMM